MSWRGVRGLERREYIGASVGTECGVHWRICMHNRRLLEAIVGSCGWIHGSNLRTRRNVDGGRRERKANCCTTSAGIPNYSHEDVLNCTRVGFPITTKGP